MPSARYSQLVAFLCGMHACSALAAEVPVATASASVEAVTCESRAKRKQAKQRARRARDKQQHASDGPRKWSKRSKAREEQRESEVETAAPSTPPTTEDADLEPVSEPEVAESVPADNEPQEPAAEPETECPEGADCVAKSGLRATLALVSGVTSRRITAPTISGLATIDTGFLPAVGLQLQLRSYGAAMFYDVGVTYQSSLGAEATQAPADPTKPALVTSIHTHRLDAGVTAGWFLGDSPESSTLGMSVGYGVRALASVVELRVPRFSLHGPVARAELDLQLGTPHLRLRLAPEVQWVLSASQDLRNRSGLSLPGPFWAFGGEISLHVLFTSRIGAQLSYRQAQTSIASVYGSAFEDVERFALLALVISYL